MIPAFLFSLFLASLLPTTVRTRMLARLDIIWVVSIPRISVCSSFERKLERTEGSFLPVLSSVFQICWLCGRFFPPHTKWDLCPRAGIWIRKHHCPGWTLWRSILWGGGLWFSVPHCHTAEQLPDLGCGLSLLCGLAWYLDGSCCVYYAIASQLFETGWDSTEILSLKLETEVGFSL